MVPGLSLGGNYLASLSKPEIRFVPATTTSQLDTSWWGREGVSVIELIKLKDNKQQHTYITLLGQFAQGDVLRNEIIMDVLFKWYWLGLKFNFIIILFLNIYVSDIR